MMRRADHGFRACVCLALAAAAAMMAGGCVRSIPPLPYPHESLLTVVAELKLFLDRDPYQWAPGRDLEGRNIFRVTLRRLDSLDGQIDPEYNDVIAFARARCHERLGQWRAAKRDFETAARAGTSLADSAGARAELAGRLAEMTDRSRVSRSLGAYFNDLEIMERDLLAMAGEDLPYPYPSYAKLEAERAIGEAARSWFAYRRIMPEGVERSLGLARRMTTDFKDSWLIAEHWIMLGEFNEMLARDITANNGVNRGGFEPENGWDTLVGQARVAYNEAAGMDGDPAKPEAQARQRALDAYSLRIQSMAR